MRSSLSLKVNLVMGLGVGGPRPRQLWLLPPPNVLEIGFDDFVSELVLFGRRVPQAEVSMDFASGRVTGALVVKNARNVSRTAQDPDSCAPGIRSIGLVV